MADLKETIYIMLNENIHKANIKTGKVKNEGFENFGRKWTLFCNSSLFIQVHIKCLKKDCCLKPQFMKPCQIIKLKILS